MELNSILLALAKFLLITETLAPVSMMPWVLLSFRVIAVTGEKEIQLESKGLPMSPSLLLRKAKIFTSLLYSRSRSLSLLREIKYLSYSLNNNSHSSSEEES